MLTVLTHAQAYYKPLASRMDLILLVNNGVSNPFATVRLVVIQTRSKNPLICAAASRVVRHIALVLGGPPE